MAEISLRDATDEDYAFLYRLHREALKDYIDQTWGWNEDWQAAYFRENFDLTGKSIIQQGGQNIGCIAVLDEGQHIFLSYIALVPSHQRMGIGTRLIEKVLQQGREMQKPVTLKVLKTNPAWALYSRLGFSITRTSDTHYLMTAFPYGGSP
jgi:ribosomal protein S18 acetylase RimI-like enzyme